MSMRIIYSLAVSLALYAGTAVSTYRAPKIGTTDFTRGLQSRMPKLVGPASAPPSRPFVTIRPTTSFKQKTAWPSSAERSALFRPTQVSQGPAGNRPMSTSSRNNFDASLTKQEAAQFLGIYINATPEQAEKAALEIRKKYYPKIWHPDPYLSAEGSLSIMKLIDEAESLFKPRNAGHDSSITKQEDAKILGVPSNAPYDQIKEGYYDELSRRMRQYTTLLYPKDPTSGLEVFARDAQLIHEALARLTETQEKLDTFYPMTKKNAAKFMEIPSNASAEEIEKAYFKQLKTINAFSPKYIEIFVRDTQLLNEALAGFLQGKIDSIDKTVSTDLVPIEPSNKQEYSSSKDDSGSKDQRYGRSSRLPYVSGVGITGAALASKERNYQPRTTSLK